MTVSLLVPPGDDQPERYRLTDDAVHDLELRSIAHGMTHRGISEQSLLAILSELPQSPHEIRYRQETSRCLWENPELCERLEDLIRSMQELTVFARSGQEAERPLLVAIWRLGELELYVELVEAVRTALDRATDLPQGLSLLRDELRSREADPAFVQLKEELPALRSGIKLHQSVTIGVNLDDKLRPVEAALLGINDQRFHEGHFLGGFLSRATGDPYVTSTPLASTAGPEALFGERVERLPLSPLFEELDSVLKSMLRPLARHLRSYVAVNTDLFRRLFPEIAFYLGSVSFLRSIAAAGYDVSFPGILEPEARITGFRGLYNVRLASHWLNREGVTRMVGNDVAFDDAARLFLLTGPNGGGKTTFTQAVGIAAVLAQSGLPVPATSGEISPLDAIHTHFPAEEEFGDELGRFEDEARRISALFDTVTDRSMVLLNEPLASTGPREAERIAESVVSGLCLAGVRGVVTTHFHELARNAAVINAEVAQETDRDPLRATLLGTLNAGVRIDAGRAQRTYRIEAGPPTGSSFAEDVARRYRLDRESLARRLQGPNPERRDLA